MSMQDPVADMLTRIRNGQASGKKAVTMPASKAKAAILKVLKEEGYIQQFSSVEGSEKPLLEVALKYHNGQPVISMLDRVSRPGLRQYSSVDELPRVMEGLGIAVVSTSRGVMTAKAAKKLGQGGEVICFVA